ncbi:HlyD family secretion protein [Niabella sp. CC-SYL272]|uniref:HlyD family secretion protein n=1 Tax=Niabella agricola TaxID=2891571 RepID=UPI001F46FAF9|nr:HlyD family efflux transporter periplasmic adaptor subunit [Niabella agricola]MCF3110619.1 HlyD family secretion protein [Niabella agricola]
MGKGIKVAEELSQEGLKEFSLNKTFQERSDIAQEIISRKPDFYEKWALLLFSTVLLLLTTSTWFIKYPDIIEADAFLTGQNAPKEIVPYQTGKLTVLFVKNNQKVKQGEFLGWLESNADPNEVIDLATRLDSSIKLVGNGSPGRIAKLFGKRFNVLGELQTDYQTFTTTLLQYSDYLVNGFYSNRKAMLRNDIVSLQTMKNKVAEQKNFITKDNELAKNTFEMNEKLFREKVISAEEYRQAQSALLNKKKADPQVDMSILAQQNLISDKQKEIDQLNIDIFHQQQTFEQALQTLKSKVDDWLRHFTIRAPTDGIVVFAVPLQQNQFIEAGKILGYVNPSDTKYYAEIRLSQNNFGKVDTGMKVQLRFDAYPYQETGFVSGTLNYVSSISVDSAFLGSVRLDGGLITNQQKTIQYRNGLSARALVITKDMRLLERLYYSIVKATSISK